MTKQECFFCHQELEVVDPQGKVEHHADSTGKSFTFSKTCEGSYFPANWHSRELEGLNRK